MPLTPEDLIMSAAACRALAYRYREYAKRQENPRLVEDFLRRAGRALRLAEHFDRELILVAQPPDLADAVRFGAGDVALTTAALRSL